MSQFIYNWFKVAMQCFPVKLVGRPYYAILLLISVFSFTVLYKAAQNDLSSLEGIFPVNTAEMSLNGIIEFEKKDIRAELEPLFENKLQLNRFLQEHTIEDGGKPYINMVVTSWRSGSTFLGEVINLHPGDFHHYEALLPIGIRRARNGSLAEEAKRMLHQLFHCNYTDMEAYIKFGGKFNFLHSHNTRLWKFCNVQPELCTNPNFLGNFCRIFPYQSVKTVRLSLNLSEEFIRDTSLNVRVLLLVRDPRGILQSRKHRDWCPGKPDCDNPQIVCQDMVDDYYVALKLRNDYPNDFQMMRYEDLSLDPYEKVKLTYDHFRLVFTPDVKEYLDLHTLANIGGVSSTFRNSKNAPFTWRFRLTPEEILDIQKHCDKALSLWGYNVWDGHSDVNEFEAIRPLNYTL